MGILKKFIVPDKRYKYPRDLGQAKRLCQITFGEMDWDEREIAIYLKDIGINRTSFEDCNKQETKSIVNSLIKGRMLLIET